MSPTETDTVAAERNVGAIADRIAADRELLRQTIREGITAGVLSEASAARAARMDRTTVRRIMGKIK